jgi:hypothetical protein
MATSYGSYMGACVLNGFGAGPAEVCVSISFRRMKTDRSPLDISARDYRRYHVPT